MLVPVPDDLESMDQLPADFDPEVVGTISEVHAALRSAVPDIGLGDPAWGEVMGPTWVIEVNIGTEDPVRSIMLHVRGGGDDVLPVVLTIARALGCGAIDLSTGDVLRTADPTGWHAFQAYRDQIMTAVQQDPAAQPGPSGG